MIIKSLTMENFRQYYGQQTIHFAHSDDRQVVTVIHGENGRGKTGIYRAIMLALFGDVKLEQDANEADVYLANMKALNDNSAMGQNAECFVSLHFQHAGEEYTVKRTYVSMLGPEGKPKERLLTATLTEHSTGSVKTNEREIQLFINGIIHEKVKHYFFFDGERIERLTRVSAAQKEEVTTGIKNLLKIDQVLKTKEVLARLLSKVKKELADHSTGEYKKMLSQQAELEKQISRLDKARTDLESVTQVNSVRLMEIDQELQLYDSMKQALIERNHMEMQVQQIEKQLNDKHEQLKENNKYLPHLLGENLLHEQFEKISYVLGDSDGLGIKVEFVDSLLSDLRCMCGTQFDKGSDQFNQLASLKESIKRYEKNQDIHSLKQEIKNTLSYLEGRQASLERTIQEYEQLLTQREQLLWNLEELNKSLTSSGETQVKVLNEEREELASANLEAKLEIEKLKSECDGLEEQLQKVNHSLDELKKKSGIHQKLLKKHDVLLRANDTLRTIIDRFETELIKELEGVTTQNLYYLLDQSGQDMMKQVKINKDYSLEVLNAFGQPFLANISQGQRQVLSLSFITALAQVAGGDRTLEMPLFMDTPFGRLSAKHQENLIEYLPQICSQWILLVTDKEFGPSEREKFISAGTVGMMYELKSVEAGVTKIVEAVPERL